MTGSRLEKNVNHFKKIKPCLTILEDRLNRVRGIDSALTPLVDQTIQGAKRIALDYKKETVKAVPLPFSVIENLVRKHVTTFRHCPEYIDPEAIRALHRIIIEFSCLCRWDCYSHLEDRHFSLEKGGEIMKIYFPYCKNDQTRKGATTVLKKTHKLVCPVEITILFFKKFGFTFGDRRSVRGSLLNCQLIYKGNKMTRLEDKLSYNTGVQTSRKVLREVGYNDWQSFTEKSSKVAGVTRLFEAGASCEAIMIIGRWKRLDTSKEYLINSDKYKQELAELMPYTSGVITKKSSMMIKLQ